MSAPEDGHLAPREEISSDKPHFQPAARSHLMDELRGQLNRWEAAVRCDEEADRFSSGCAAIDRLLPGGGLRHGMLIEWLATHVAAGGSPVIRTTGEPPVATFGGGGATLALLAAREACREGGTLVVLDRQQTFYPPAAAGWGIDLDRLIVVRPRSARDELWAAVESLRSAAVAVVWGAIDRLDSRGFRRLQLAAQAGRTLGLLLRPPSARGQPSWADVRLGVESRVESRESRARIPALDSRLLALDSLRRVQVCVLRTRGGRPGSSVILKIDDDAHTVTESIRSSFPAGTRHPSHVPHPLPVVAELADPAAPSRSARA